MNTVLLHNPAPWRAEGIVVNDAAGNTLCLCPQGDTLEQTQANACLIAAAPDLLAAALAILADDQGARALLQAAVRRAVTS